MVKRIFLLSLDFSLSPKILRPFLVNPNSTAVKVAGYKDLEIEVSQEIPN